MLYEKKISIIILTYNQLEYTKACIASIREYTEDTPYEIIVVDNHSTDGTSEWLGSQKDIQVIFNGDNLGFPKGCNQGIEMAGTENDILLLNNDVVVTRNWLANLKTALYSEDKIGAVGAVTNYCSNCQAISVNYKDMEEMQTFAAENNIPDSSAWEYKHKLIGFCMLIKRDALQVTGMLDERFSPGNYEDDDYSYRLLQQGFALLLCHDVFIHHHGSATFGRDVSAYNELLQVNDSKFKSKWGFSPSYSGNIRHDIIDYIKRHPKASMRVLEVGCACGATLLRVKHLYKNTELYGIELNEGASKIAANFAEVLSADIERTVLDFPPGYFDYIIFADVLEHLYDPWKVLGSIKKYLKPKGKVLASIPNVMHYSVIFDLIYGNWAYTDAGILDRTHLRFFTMNEIQKMFIQAGYTMIDISGKTLTGDSMYKEYLKILSTISSKDLESQYAVYQYLVCAEKPE